MEVPRRVLKRTERFKRMVNSADSPLERSKDRVADLVQVYANHLRADSLALAQRERRSLVMDYRAKAVRRMDAFAARLRGHSTRALMGQVGRFARRHRLGFLGGAAAIGWATGRLLKSS